MDAVQTRTRAPLGCRGQPEFIWSLVSETAEVTEAIPKGCGTGDCCAAVVIGIPILMFLVAYCIAPKWSVTLACQPKHAKERVQEDFKLSWWCGRYGTLLSNHEKGPIMMTTRLAIAALVSVGLVGAPFAVEAKKHQHYRHHISTIQSGTYGARRVAAPRSGPYGTSGTSIGTVTAPSVGSYYWPSVGVTNAVPTWSNTNPPVRR
jgi:hypothetical protein